MKWIIALLSVPVAVSALVLIMPASAQSRPFCQVFPQKPFGRDFMTAMIQGVIPVREFFSVGGGTIFCDGPVQEIVAYTIMNTRSGLEAGPGATCTNTDRCTIPEVQYFHRTPELDCDEPQFFDYTTITGNYKMNDVRSPLDSDVQSAATATLSDFGDPNCLPV